MSVDLPKEAESDDFELPEEIEKILKNPDRSDEEKEKLSEFFNEKPIGYILELIEKGIIPEDLDILSSDTIGNFNKIIGELPQLPNIIPEGYIENLTKGIDFSNFLPEGYLDGITKGINFPGFFPEGYLDDITKGINFPSLFPEGYLDDITKGINLGSAFSTEFYQNIIKNIDLPNIFPPNLFNHSISIEPLHNPLNDIYTNQSELLNRFSRDEIVDPENVEIFTFDSPVLKTVLDVFYQDGSKTLDQETISLTESENSIRFYSKKPISKMILNVIYANGLKSTIIVTRK